MLMRAHERHTAHRLMRVTGNGYAAAVRLGPTFADAFANRCAGHCVPRWTDFVEDVRGLDGSAPARRPVN